jgi:long-chain fatty acid transport protein
MRVSEIALSCNCFLKSFDMKKKYTLAVITILLCSLQSFSQNGTRLIGFDAKTTGRGGTSTGFFDNPSLMMNNPAGLSFLKSGEIDLSISLMAPAVHFKNSINNTDGKDNIFPMGCLSYAHTPFRNLTYAAGIFTQGGMGADFNLNHDLFKDQSGNYVQQTYHSKFAVMQAGASFAYRLTNQLSIGATANLVYGQVEFRMPMAMPPSMLKGIIDPQSGYTFGDMFSASPETNGLGYSELVAAANMKGLTAYGFNGKIGFAFKPNEKFSGGINYSLPVSMKYKNGKAKMDMSYQMNDAFGRVVAGIMQQDPNMSPEQAQQAAMNQFAQLGIDLTKGAADNYKARAAFGLPQSFSTGLFFAASKKIRLALDAEWINWKNAFDNMDISLTNGTNQNINRVTGATGNLEMAFPLKWKNTIVIRSGGEFDITKKLTFRCGYVYGSNPVPGSTVFPVFPAVVKHHITLGSTVRLRRSLDINLAYEYAFRNDETCNETSLIANEYNNSTSSLKNNIFHASVSWYVR